MEEEFYDNNNNINELPKNINTQAKEFDALQDIIKIISSFDKPAVKKLIKTIITFYELDDMAFEVKKEFNQQDGPKFSDNRDISPKNFIMEKNPQTDVERVACLAYYLTHYRGQEEFKTLDISKLNTEAAQLKFTNPAFAVDHANRHAQFLVQTKKGFKKLSAIGELYVQALPNREEAKEIIKRSKPKRKPRKNKNLTKPN